MNAEPPFTRPVALRVDQVSTGLQIAADADERAGVAEELDLLALDRLTAEGELARHARGLVWQGRVRANVTQACVVTFEPIHRAIDVAVERLFVLGSTPATGEVAVEPEDPDIEYLTEPTIDLGALAVEELALALDPYPRSAGADAVVDRYRAAEPASGGAFGVLARRRLDA